jgi:hypothetical protein
MSTVPDPYVSTHPGDLITAQLFNGVQSTIKQDIADKIAKAVSEIKSVDKSGDSAKLEGKSPKDLEEEIIKRALEEFRRQASGYQMIFKRLTKDKESVINHDLCACPLVDVYQLDYFEVVCADGEAKENKFVNFYLYHSDEKKQKSATAGERRSIVIEPTDGTQAFKIPFAKMLKMVGVHPDDGESLGDIVTEFWEAFFKLPNNDQFDPDQYCHSPWFEKCCGEQRSLATLKQRGNWDEIWFQMRPRKVVQFRSATEVFARQIGSDAVLPALPNALADVQVVHFNFDTAGVRLLADPVYPMPIVEGLSEIAKKELKVMLLLKV